MKTLGRKISVFSVVALMTACSQTGSSDLSGTSSLDPKTQALVSFKLTDAPNKSLKSVFVNIDHMEVLVAGKGKSGRLILSKDLGMVDLLTLQNGVTMGLQDVVAPQGISIQQIRLVLKSEGHYAVKADDSICQLKTPSAEKTGVKIILTNKIEFEAGHEYSIVVDFDALKSVVIQGNGDCLLKPVLKLKSALKKPLDLDDSDDNQESDSQCQIEAASKPESADAVSDSTDSSEVPSEVSSDQSESTNDSNETQVEEELNNCSASAPDGEELALNADQNDSTNTDGWDYVPVVDGVTPVLTEQELQQLL